MNPYSAALVAELRTAGHDVHAPWPTGGGCEQIYIAAGGTEIGITNGDAALPDGTAPDGVLAYISARNADGDEIDAATVVADGSIIDALEQLIARLP